MENGQKPINPMNAQVVGEGEITTEYQSEFSLVQLPGLTKKEYFSAMAMIGLLSNNGSQTDPFIVRRSIYLADELLKQLNTNP